MSDKKNESKQDKFIRVAEPRVSRAVKSISLLGNLAGSGYEYTEGQVEAMFAAVQEAADSAKAQFTRKQGVQKFRF